MPNRKFVIPKRSEGSASNAVRDFLFIFEFVGAPSFPPLEGWELLTFTPANNRASSPTQPNEPVFAVDLRQGTASAVPKNIQPS
jgi:hypothetical protein